MNGKKKETITYTSKDCEHDHLIKMAPLWYVCKNCGEVFLIPFSLQFNYNQALEHLARIAVGIKENQKLIKAGEKRTALREKKEELEAIKRYEKNKRLSRNSKSRGN